MYLHRMGVAGALAMACAIAAPVAASAATHHHAAKPPKAKPGQRIVKSTAKTPTGYTCQRKRLNGRMWKVCVKQTAAPTPTSSAPSTSPPVSSAPSSAADPTPPPVTSAPSTSAPTSSGGGGGGGGGGGSTPPPPSGPVTSTVYSNYTFPGYWSSQPFLAAQVKEYGGQVTLGPGARSNAVVRTVIASYACETGDWYNANCVTTPGATYDLPIWLSVYNLDPDGSVGTAVIRTHQTKTIAYRPSTDHSGTCTTQQYIGAGGVCRTNLPTQVSFDLGSAVLPTNAIITVAIDTSASGWDPTGVVGPADSTNVAYVQTPGGPDVFEATTGDLEPVDSGGYQPVFRVDTTG
jgi:hypothetical protein